MHGLETHTGHGDKNKDADVEMYLEKDTIANTGKKLYKDAGRHVLG
jgi:hypothetical protein